MDIADIATTEYVEIDADKRLSKVRSLFDRDNPKGLIVTEGGEYAGIINQKQLLQSHIQDDAKVRGLIRSAPKVSRGDDVREVARVLVESGAKIAPVFEGESLWGVVTENAILSAVLDNLDALDVSEIYTDSVVTVSTETNVGTVINRLREHGISRLPVLDDEDGALTGMVTTHDIAGFAVRNMERQQKGDRSGDIDRILDIPVYDIMNSPVATTTGAESVETAVRRMLDNDYAGLVVTPGDDDTVAGIITKTDVLRALTFTEEDHMDVQITNIKLLDTITREEIREQIGGVSDKYRDMRVHHAHVRFHKHKERLRGTPLIQAQIRLRTNRGQVAGSGEGYGAETAFNVALDKLERQVLELKGVEADEEYRGQLLRKLGEL